MLGKMLVVLRGLRPHRSQRSSRFQMDPITSPVLAQPPAIAGKRGFPRRLAEGVSKPPWSWRAAGVVVLISFATFFGVPELLYVIWGVRGRDVLFPVLVSAMPTLCCLRYLAKKSGTTADSVFGLRGARFGAVLVSGIILFVLEVTVLIAADVLLRQLGLRPGPQDGQTAQMIASSPFILIDATVWAPFCEELTFRGLVYTSLRTRLGVTLSIIITAAAFALIHSPASIHKVGVFFFDALLSSFWYERTRSLWPNIMSHALNNILISVLRAV